MKKLLNLQSESAQNGSLATEQEKPCHLKLVISNSSPVSKKQKLKARNTNLSFTAEIQEKGYSHYTLVAHDPFHYLECEINLEIRNNEYVEELKPGTVICHFPDIATDDLDELIEEDEMLHGMILIQFQLKILEQILLFCGDQADGLNVLVEAEDRPEGNILAAYEKLAIHEHKVPTPAGTKIQMIIPASLESFDGLVDFMDDFSQEFQQMLWKDKGSNPAIWNYLKLTRKFASPPAVAGAAWHN